MNELLRLYDDAAKYPRSLAFPRTYDHTLTSYIQRLNACDGDLFCHESNAQVDFWQYDYSGQGYWDTCVRSHDELDQQLRIRASPQRYDPKCLFVFLHAPHSRERLNVTREMLLSLLTYYQVMPAFLDFLFPFGRSQDVQDFLYSGFRHETRLSTMERDLRIPELDRSGRRLQLCYSLRSPSQTGASKKWQWSIQQTAIYHSFDVETGLSLWMLVKGDLQMKGDGQVRNRVVSATKSPDFPYLRSFGSRDDSFSAALGSHQLFADWAGENWRWYINFLEKKVQEITRKTLDVSVKTPLHPLSASGQAAPNAQGTLAGKQKSATWTIGRMLTFPKQPPPLPVLQPQQANKSGRPMPPVLPPSQIDEKAKQASEKFSFDDLQEIESVEEKTNEALLVLKTLLGVLSELKAYYDFVLNTPDCPSEIKANCKTALLRFGSALGMVEIDLRLQLSRVETLLRLLADRKTLLYSILQSQSTDANMILATKAKESADKMELMTKRMHQIAIKTQQETVSMKVITVVTLIFLPGTFVSTLMSTDIVKFQTESATGSGKLRRVYSSGALKLFVEITVPLMAATLVAWFVAAWWIDRRQKRAVEREVAAVESYV